MVLFSTLLRFIVIVDTSNRNGTEDRVTTPPPQASAICHHLQLEAWRLPSLPSHAQPHARLRCTGTHLCLILLSLSSCLQSTGVLLKKSLGRGPLSHLQTGKINGNSGEYLTRSQGLEFSSRLSMSSFRLESDKIHTLPRACPLSLSFKKKSSVHASKIYIQRNLLGSHEAVVGLRSRTGHLVGQGHLSRIISLTSTLSGPSRSLRAPQSTTRCRCPRWSTPSPGNGNLDGPGAAAYTRSHCQHVCAGFWADASVFLG